MTRTKRSDTAKTDTAKAPRQRRKGLAEPAVLPPAKKGRKRAEAATGFARWLDDQKVSIDEIAAAVGISSSSLYQIRRGEQGVSLATATKLIVYSGNVLTLNDFTAGTQN